jgi:hypothetical protein
MIATGQLPETDLSECVGKLVGKGGGAVTGKPINGRTLYEVKDGARAMYFAYGRADTVVLGNTEAYVLEAINRHTLTPGGWVHEQDNTKLVIGADGKRHALARERGINSYTRIADFDFTPGREYWSKTNAYWADVRAAWTRGSAAKPTFVLEPDPDAEPRINELFGQADRAGKGETVTSSEIEDVLIHYGLPLPAPTTAPSP